MAIEENSSVRRLKSRSDKLRRRVAVVEALFYGPRPGQKLDEFLSEVDSRSPFLEGLAEEAGTSDAMDLKPKTNNKGLEVKEMNLGLKAADLALMEDYLNAKERDLQRREADFKEKYEEFIARKRTLYENLHTKVLETYVTGAL